MTYSTIGDHVKLQRGTTYKSALLDQPGPVLLGLGSIERDGGFRSDKLRTYGGPSPEKLLVRPEDLYVSLKDVTQSGDLLGAIARVPISVSVGRMTQDTVKLIFKSDIPKDYFYWLLRTPQYRQHCRSHATGTTNLGLSRDDFFGFKIPDLDKEKRLLIDSLENIEARIRTNHQINQTLEQIAQAIFKSWFVDFEPVKAKIAALEAGGSEEDALLAAMQAISGSSLSDASASTAGADAQLTRLQAEQPEQYAKLRATAELFPSAMQDSELGEIPEGWETKKVGNYLNSISKTFPLKNVDEIIFLNTGDIKEGRFLHSEKSPTVGLPGQAKKSIQKDDILYSEIRPKNKRYAYVHFESDDYVVSTKLIVLRSTAGIDSKFLYFILTQEKIIDHLQMMAESRSGTFPQITFSALESVDFIGPSNNHLLNIFSKKFLSTFMCERFALENQNMKLENLRDALLPKLLSGELSVSDAEDQLAEAAETANV